MALEIHPAANIFPLLEGEAFRSLAEDIRENGQREDIILFEGKVLDGRNRLRACEDIGIEPYFVELEECDDPVGYVLSLNLHRRHLNEAQRAMVAARVKEFHAKEAKERSGVRTDLVENLPPGSFGKARDKAGEALQVSGKSVDHAEKVIKTGAPELSAACDAGELPVSSAAKVASLPEPEQKEILHEASRHPKGIKKGVSEALKKRSEPVATAKAEKTIAQPGAASDDAPAWNEADFVLAIRSLVRDWMAFCPSDERTLASQALRDIATQIDNGRI